MKRGSTFFGNGMTVLACLLGLMLSSGASAQEARPCAEDAKKLCKGVEPGEGRIVRCMKEHESELSPACRDNVAKFKERAREIAEACKEDVQKNCKNVKRGGGRIVQCLKQHVDALSPECKENLSRPNRKQ